MGYLQYYFLNEWLNISYLSFDSQYTDSACQYFGYKTGLLITKMEETKLTNLILSVFCPKQFQSFRSCFLKINNDSVTTLRASKIMIVCSNEHFTCPLMEKSSNMTIEKFFGNCYYIFNMKEKKLNYAEMKNFCMKKNLTIVLITIKEQARFIFNKILMEKIQSEKKIKNHFRLWKFEKQIFIPLSRISF